jgi:predicted site-specific integrase-resolvase
MPSLYEETWYSLAEISEISGIAVRTLRRHVREGRLEAVALGGRGGYKVSGTAWEQFIASRKVVRTAKSELGSGAASSAAPGPRD